MFKKYRNPSDTSLLDPKPSHANNLYESHPLNRTESAPRNEPSLPPPINPKHASLDEYASEIQLNRSTLKQESEHLDDLTPASPAMSFSENTMMNLGDTWTDESPETTLGEGVIFKGQLSFERLLRIDGCMEGELISNGRVLIGPNAIVRSNIEMESAVIEGDVEGDIHVHRLELRGNAKVQGNITAQSLIVDETVSLSGHVSITPEKKDFSDE